MYRNSDNTKAIGYIDIRVFQHATENAEKVQTAVKNLLTPQLQETLIFEKTSCTGHHGNPIILFTAKLKDKKQLPTALEKIGKGLGALDREELDRDIKLHIERSNLYLRFDKQSAFMGAPRFSQNDPIHVKIHFKNKASQEIIEFSKQTGLLP